MRGLASPPPAIVTTPKGGEGGGQPPTPAGPLCPLSPNPVAASHRLGLGSHHQPEPSPSASSADEAGSRGSPLAPGEQQPAGTTHQLPPTHRQADKE